MQKFPLSSVSLLKVTWTKIAKEVQNGLAQALQNGHQRSERGRFGTNESLGYKKLKG